MNRLLHALNYAPFFRGSQSVWGSRVFYPCLDRWLYLTLHRVGAMGAEERRVIDALVKPGMHVLDVGGNVGLYASYFAQKVGAGGHVSVVEPVNELRGAIEQMVRTNGLTQVEVFPFAAGEKDGEATIHRDLFNSGNNSLAGVGAAEVGAQTIPVRRLDSLSLPRCPDLIKIDVQGWEEKAFLGMERFFQQTVRPVILCEICQKSLVTAGSSAAKVLALLSQHGYQFRIATSSGSEVVLEEISAAQIEARAAKEFYFDIIAVP